MEALRVGKQVKSIVQLEKDAYGQYVPVSLYVEAGKKKRGTRGARAASKVIRRLAQAQQAYMDTYLSRHDRSNGKRRDGWLRDLPLNVMRATRSGTKKLRPARWITSF